jgi:putative ABC transport system permease protein
VKIVWRWRKRADEDFNNEIQAHVAFDADRLMAEGMRPEEAKAAALRAFGNITLTQERFYESRRVMWLDNLRRDARLALRTLAKGRAFTTAAILTLVLGVGATTAIATIVDSILLKPLPYPDSDRIVQVISYRTEGRATVRSASMARPFILGLRERSRSFSELGVFDSFSNITRRRLSMTVAGRFGAGELYGTRISPQLLALLGVRAQIGRALLPGDERPERNRLILLSDRAWRTEYVGDAGILGSSLVIDGQPYTLIGIMPREFAFPDPQTDFWIPLTSAPVPPPSAPRSDSL